VDLSVYIRKIRIAHASELLKKPGAIIDDVAEKSGFSDRIHFTKVFRRVTGQTPGQYQRQYRTGGRGDAAAPHAAARLRSKNPRSVNG
jgi:beta-glucosidase